MKRKTITLVFQIISTAVVLTIIILNVAQCHAQDWSVLMGVGGVRPAERTFANVEFRHRIAPRYSLAVAGELSPSESNVSPKLAIDLWKGLSAEAAFGWGHKWQDEGCNDHNFHTYTLGLAWTKQIADRWSFYIGPSMLWRSFQGHIGFHKGTLRLCAGISYKFYGKRK